MSAPQRRGLPGALRPAAAPRRPVERPQSVPSPLRVSVVVPYRPGCSARERNFAYVTRLYEEAYPGWEIVVSDSETATFSRSNAICDGAARATGDILVIADADVWSAELRVAAELVANGAAWVNPASSVVRLDRSATQRLAECEGPFERHLGESELKVPCGGLVVLSRQTFTTCPPDRRFVGWGGEDNAWSEALETLVGRAVQLRAPLWHLWHPQDTAPALSKDNTALLRKYQAARQDSRAMRELVGGTARASIVFVVDQPDWAFASRARQVSRRLGVDHAFQTVTFAEVAAGRAPRSCDVLYVFYHPFLRRVATAIRHRRLVVNVSSYKPWEEPAERMPELLAALQRADAVTAINAQLGDWLRAFTDKPVHVCPSGLDLDEFPVQPLPDTFTVGWAGNSMSGGSQELKGLPLLEAACRKAGVPLVVTDRYVKGVPKSAMPAFYGGISCLACVSRSEGTPNPVLEALASGRVVISTPVGVVRETVRNGVTGLFVERTIDNIAEAIVRVQDWNLSALQPQARAAAERWSWDRQIEPWKTLFGSVLR